jgi:hypothetical protein
MGIAEYTSTSFPNTSSILSAQLTTFHTLKMSFADNKIIDRKTFDLTTKVFFIRIPDSIRAPPYILGQSIQP